MDPTPANYRRLDAQKIIETVRDMQKRIERRFPDSSLSKVVAELLHVAEETVDRTRWIQKPNRALRFGVGVLILGILTVIAGLLVRIRQFQVGEFANFVQALEASLGSLVFIGAAILFLVSWENRIKRNRALKALHELRALAHIVDMHQLTKDPEVYFGRASRVSPPKRPMTPFELNRYLDYCGDSLALISKIAALHVQDFQDPVLLTAVDEVEELTSGLSRKIWQKITLLESMTRSLPEQGPKES